MVEVVQSSQANAFVLPGGKIVVYTGVAWAGLCCGALLQLKAHQ